MGLSCGKVASVGDVVLYFIRGFWRREAEKRADSRLLRIYESKSVDNRNLIDSTIDQMFL